MTYAPTVDALKTWIERHWQEWYDDPIAELENRDAIRDQALGAAYSAHDLDAPARYEVHLDRKLGADAGHVDPVARAKPKLPVAQDIKA